MGVHIQMSDNKDTSPRKVADEHESIVSHVRTGHCPRCRALMSYRDNKVTQCLCCGLTVEWNIED